MTGSQARRVPANAVTLTSAITGLEKTLLDLCEDVTGEALRPDEDFFEAGVDSLAVAEVFHAVQARLGVQVPLRVAVENPSVRSLARWVATTVPDTVSARSLVRMSRRPAGRRFFCVHGIGGHVLVFGPLARRLEGVIDFYAFEAPGRSDPARGDRTIEAMAARYVRDLKRTQAQGPYALGGYSMGGVVALEMAHQLVGGGDRVDLVAMLDTAARPPNLVSVGNRSIEFVSRALGIYPPVTAPYESLEEGAAELCRRLASDVGRVGIEHGDIVGFAEAYMSIGEAWSRYQPPAYGGDVVIYYTNAGDNSPIPEPAAPDRAMEVLGWADVIDPCRTRIVVLPGDHWTMLGRDLEPLAESLEAELARANRGATDTGHDGVAA